MDLKELKNNSVNMPQVSGEETLEEMYKILGQTVVEAIKEPYDLITVKVTFTDADVLNNNEPSSVISAQFRYTVQGSTTEKSFLVNKPVGFFKQLRQKFEEWSKNKINGFVLTLTNDHQFDFKVTYK